MVEISGSRSIAGAVVLASLCLIVAGRLVWKNRKGLSAWFDETFRRARFYDVLKTFCAEAAVLWLVFPVIDVWEKNGTDWLIVYISPGAAAIFLILAGIFARREEEMKNSEESKK